MDAAELEHLCTTLIAEARVLARHGAPSAEFREVVRHAHEMHDLLLEALLAHEPLAAPHLRGLAQSTANAPDELGARTCSAHHTLH